MSAAKQIRALALRGAALSCAAVGAAALWQGLRIQTYSLPTALLNRPIRLALLSDLHSGFYGEHQVRLLAAIGKQAPDCICLTGDIVDDKRSWDGALQLLSVIGKAYPCFYVSGNHEWRSGDIAAIKQRIRDCSITVLEGSSQILMLHGQRLKLCGADDPDIGKNIWTSQLKACGARSAFAPFTVFLTHRPEYAPLYQQYPFDLILAGHAHGGQVRLPGVVNGLWAPGQGWLPAYAGGLYSLEAAGPRPSTLIVSRGLCRNLLPRVFNRPELVIVDLLPAAYSEENSKKIL